MAFYEHELLFAWGCYVQVAYIKNLEVARAAWPDVPERAAASAESIAKATKLATGGTVTVMEDEVVAFQRTPV